MTFSRVVLAPVVEGQGEERAFPVLLRRLAERAEYYQLQIAPPVRLPRSQMTRPDDIRRAVRHAARRITDDRGAVIILLDSDDECAVRLSSEIRDHISSIGLKCGIVVIAAQREYESIFLAATPSLTRTGLANPDAEVPANPENIRGAKERLKKILIDGRYKETQEQERLTAKIDLDEALSCRWLRKLEKELNLMFGQFPSEYRT